MPSRPARRRAPPAPTRGALQAALPVALSTLALLALVASPRAAQDAPPPEPVPQDAPAADDAAGDAAHATGDADAVTTEPSEAAALAAPEAAPGAAPDVAAGDATPEPLAEPVDELARATFLQACATCHGEDGSGTGPTVLDRPARDFKSGGFSFGNTSDALLRTITHGIPGTPMPAFGEAYDDALRERLAAYVRTLGPPVDEPDASGRVMLVTDRPRLVRGILPPVGASGVIRPRGLLIGTPEGLSFEYRIDDVRLLAVRQGDYVERTDWIGRGGTALAPLGGPLLAYGDGDPPPTFLRTGGDASGGGDASDAPASALSARLVATSEAPRGVMLDYALAQDGEDVARVFETVRETRHPTGSGWTRRLVIRASGAAGVPLGLSLSLAAPAALLERVGGDGSPAWVVAELSDGRALCQRVSLVEKGAGPDAPPPPWRVDEADGGLRLAFELAPGAELHVDLLSLLLPAWDDAARALLLDGGAVR